MEAVALLDEQKLREQLAQAREKVDGLVRKLRAVEAELEGLSGERQQHRWLSEACGALEKLDELGAARLFWGEGAVEREAADRIRIARGHIDAFQKRLGEIEERQEGLIEEIDQHERTAWLIEGGILDAQEQEARRAEEWIIEREIDVFPVRQLLMPWTRGGEDDQRFRKSLATSLLLGLLLCLLLPLVDLPLPGEEEEIAAPERMTRLIPEHPRTPPPVVQARPQEAKPVPVEKLVAEQAAPKPGPQEAPAEAPGTKGILAFKEQFSGLADNKPAARLGHQARISRAGEVASGTPERSLVTTQAPGSSGGINLAALSRGMGGVSGQQLEGIQVARATSSIAATGGGASGSGHAVDGEGPQLGRTDEEIQIVFDRHKAALYRLYNRELRSDPTLKGQMVLRLRIEPDGSVSLCELQASDMNAAQLSAQVVERVKSFDFGAKEGILAITILYPIDFLPAT